MVNYDLPWNPNRLEQKRFGRIHRIGQKKFVIYGIFAKDTREAMHTFNYWKLEIAREAWAIEYLMFLKIIHWKIQGVNGRYSLQ